MRDREYREMELRLPFESQAEEKRYTVEGYASTFEPYILFEQDGVKYSERIEPTAFDDADMADVVFRIDHEGAVYARTSAGTVNLWVDEHGLGQRTDLSKTQRAREVFSEKTESGMTASLMLTFWNTPCPGGNRFIKL